MAGTGTTPEATTAVAAPLQPAGDEVRLVLHPDARHRTMLDGGWWPHTADLSRELPPLIAELERRGTHIIRATYHPATWNAAPRTVPIGRRVIHVGWFREIDPHLISLTGANQERVELLVVPPDTARETAERAMTTAALPDNHASPSDVLSQTATAVCETPAATRRPGGDSDAHDRQDRQDRQDTLAWDSEGGRTSDS